MSTLPPSVHLETGLGGLPVVRVTAPAATAEIYLHGAHVTSWVPLGGQPVVWLSAASRFDADSAIRGGVPICFPWFGARAGHPEAPQHGFARLSDWELVDAHDQGDEVVVQLRLTDSEATRASAWPYMFAATFTVVVGAQLSMTLDVINRDTTEFTFEEALHTYLAVGDVRSTEVSGLEGTPYVDRPTGPDPVPGEPGPVRFTGPHLPRDGCADDGARRGGRALDQHQQGRLGHHGRLEPVDRQRPGDGRLRRRGVDRDGLRRDVQRARRQRAARTRSEPHHDGTPGGQ
jgi:glucose-6-phosphate 1-epimerase